MTYTDIRIFSSECGSAGSFLPFDRSVSITETGIREVATTKILL